MHVITYTCTAVQFSASSIIGGGVRSEAESVVSKLLNGAHAFGQQSQSRLFYWSVGLGRQLNWCVLAEAKAKASEFVNFH